MLPGKLLELVENVPEMKNWEISDDEGGQEPVTPMDKVIVIEVVPNIRERELAVIVISVVTLSQVLIEGGIKVAQKPSAILWSVIEHHQDEAEVDQRQHADDSPESLRWVEEVESVRLQVSISAQE